MGLHLFVLCLPTQHPKEVNHKTIDMKLNEISFLLSQDFDFTKPFSQFNQNQIHAMFFFLHISL